MSRGLNIAVNIGGKLLPSLNSSASGVERRMKGMVRTFKLGTAEMKSEWRAFSKSMKPLAGLAAAGGLSMGFKSIIGDGSNFIHEVAALRLAGRTAGEVAKAMRQAHKTAADVPTSTLTENLKILRETTGAYGDLGHAMENLSFNQRLGYMMTNVMGMDREESMSKLVAGIQALEIRGSAMDHTRYQREMNALFQASSFFAGKEGAFTPESLRAFAKTGNIPLKMFSERFMTRILPAMITEVGSGDIVGTQASAFNNWLNGNTGTGNKSKTEFAKQIGLVNATDPSQLTQTGWKVGAVAGTDLAKTDPLKWVETILLPKLAKAGFNVNDTKSLEMGVSKLFGRETAKRFIMGLADKGQRGRLHRDEANIIKAMGPEEGYKFMLANDPQAAWAKVMSKLDNLATTLGEKVFTDKTIAAIDKFANGIDKLSGFFDKHPTLAKGAVGGMGLGAAGGFMALFGGGGLIKLLGKGLGKGIMGLAAGLGRFLVPLGTALLNGLVALAPTIIEGFAAAFALLSNPIGWAVILGGVALALIWYFWDDLKAIWNNTIVPGWNKLWTGIRDWALSVDWGSVGMKIADFLTFGLASKVNASSWGSIIKGAVTGFAVGGPVGAVAGGVAGARANGGPVRSGLPYLVGERGPEIMWPARSGYVSPNSHIRAMQGGPRHARPGRTAPLVGSLHISGGSGSPAEMEAAAYRALKRVANEQAALLSD